MTDYDVVQNFSILGPNRGHLCIVADELRPAPKLTNAELRGAELMDRIVELLKAGPMTAREIRLSIGQCEPAISSSLVRLRCQRRVTTERINLPRHVMSYRYSLP